MPAILAALLLAAADGAPEPRTTVWLATPTAKQFEAAYPKAARKFAYAGKVEVECAIAADGRLADCMAVSEDPPRRGFAEAALKLAPAFQVRPEFAAERRAIRFPLDFRLAPDTRPAPIQVASADYDGLTAELDCRYDNFVLDNCFVTRTSGEALGFEPAALAAAGRLQFRQTRFLTGRMALTLQFVANPAGPTGAPRGHETPRRGPAPSR